MRHVEGGVELKEVGWSYSKHSLDFTPACATKVHSVGVVAMPLCLGPQSYGEGLDQMLV